ncbi:hypothetical protein [Agriterribacter sp.]|uniref:hypothetical protein n=1 Tax=Agriterribacter sp. TaxID=2821509 RepID=UPI002BB053A7|nr:hypothetical protein [Agriterribacter sp.]HRO46811.1 hypothetical protein [Agriterribacter sp.]HRQ15580.1 hypothetical protein [Agriterribacter sp.]
MKIKWLHLFILIILVATGNAQNNSQDFDYGRVENGKYLNSFLHFEITLPAGWVVQSREQIDYLAKKGAALVTGDDEKMKAVYKAAEINVANLLGVYQYELGSPVDYNPSIMLVAENVQHSPGVKKGSDYLFQARKLLDQSQFQYDYLDTEFEKEVVSRTDFYKMNTGIKYAGLDIKQIYFSTVIKRFSLNIIISFTTDEQKEVLLKSVHSIAFHGAGN